MHKNIKNSMAMSALSATHEDISNNQFSKQYNSLYIN
jgi:hypothetical protein